MKSMIKIIVIVALLFAFNVNAAFIDNDIYTTDTYSGLDWLDLTETIGMSHNDVALELGPGGIFDGWAFATANQVESLFDNAGGNGSYYSTTSDCCSYYTQPSIYIVDDLLSLWGITYYASVGWGASFIYTDTEWSNGPLALGWLEVDPGGGYMMLQYLSASIDPDIGGSHALVRVSSVPVPAAFWLFISGIMLLISTRLKVV